MKRQKCLMLGCGHKPPKRQYTTLLSAPEDETEWITLDMNPKAKPDVLFDLERIELIDDDNGSLYGGGNRLPFKDSEFDEIHGYSVFEHYGRQGHWRGFFAGFRELWRVLKPSGLVIGGVPAYDDYWALADPGHTRVITDGTLSYLTKGFYEERLGVTTSSDYREYVEPYWWELVHAQRVEVPNGGIWPPCFAFYFGLQKVV